MPKVFSAETCSSGELIVTPLRNVSSLAEEEVRQELETVIQQLQDTQTNRVVVDFSKVSYFGSSMLEAMLQIWNEVRDREGAMALCGLSEVGREIVRIARFDTLWSLHDTRAEAIDALNSDETETKPPPDEE